jgi:diguanylate cyclase
MTREINLKDTDLAEFEEKVYVIAAEVLDILKELSLENQKQINSKTIAEKMFRNESVKNLLANYAEKPSDGNSDADRLKEISNIFLDKLTEIAPSSLTENLTSLKDSLNDNDILRNSTDWLDSPVGIIKKYINSITKRNKELEEFLKQTMQYLATIEGHFSNELSSQQLKFKEDRNFEKDISSNVNTIKQSFNASYDFSNIKMEVLNKIDSISKGIEKKREQDIQRLKDTENTLKEMGNRMNEIKQEADEIRKKSQEVEYESYHDALTGLYNRKAYEDKLQETVANLERYNVPASMIICDIDFFKKINDNFGHKVGDLALKKLAELLKERLRINDFISRYGGEEFVIILPHTDINGALTAGEGIRAYIDKSVFSYKEQKIPLTISVGVSSFKKGVDGGAVFEKADNALYLAKKSGRNKVKTEDDVPAEGAG